MTGLGQGCLLGAGQASKFASHPLPNIDPGVSRSLAFQPFAKDSAPNGRPHSVKTMKPRLLLLLLLAGLSVLRGSRCFEFVIDGEWEDEEVSGLDGGPN